MSDSPGPFRSVQKAILPLVPGNDALASETILCKINAAPARRAMNIRIEDRACGFLIVLLIIQLPKSNLISY